MASMKKFSLVLFLIPTIWFQVIGQNLSTQLDSYFRNAQIDWKIPGMAIGIIKDGNIVLAEGYGFLETYTTEEVNEHTLFAIASNTKAFIATSLGILVEEGKLKWSDPVRKYLPNFELPDDYATQHTTIRDLLCHRAGLGTYSGDVIWYKSQLPPAEVVGRIKNVPMKYDFRNGYGYSNLMFITAGEVIQTVSGISWDEFVKKRIFTPLEMDRTVTSTNELSEKGNFATPHKPKPGINMPINWTNWDNMGAAGGIISSVSDMLKWIQLHLAGGKVGNNKIYDEKLQTEMWHPHNVFRVTKNTRQLFPTRNLSGYGLGWSLFDHGKYLVANHGGGYDGMYSKVFLVPEANLGGVILTNSMKGISNPMMYYILDRFLSPDSDKDWSADGLKNQKRNEERIANRVNKRNHLRIKDTKPSIPVDRFAGTYRCKMYGDIVVEEEDGDLKLLFSHAPKLNATLTHWHFNTYQINWEEEHAWFDFGTVQFILDNNAEVSEIRFDVPNDDIFFEEIHAVRMK